MVIQAKWQRVDVEELTAPRTGMFMVYVDYYWVVTENNELLFYKFGNDRRRYGAPQCNSNKEITEKVARCIVDIRFDIRQLPVVYVPLNPSDYV